MGLEIKGRLKALDLFRGITIAGMILVNNPGTWSNVYSPLLHANWHGCTPTDLVFPFFLFIVGVSIHLALGKMKLQNDNKNKLIIKILKRALMLFAIGLFLNGFPYFDLVNLRIPGVLQRIALVYFFASVLYLNLSLRALNITGVFILLAYWILMALDPTVAAGQALFEKGANVTNVFDNWLLEGHLWRHSKTWDPEGVLSTIPAIVTSILGINAGVLLKEKDKTKHLSGYFLLAGSVLVLLGLAWGLVFPINKSLWTSSYVLYTGGIAFLSLGSLHFLVDVLGRGERFMFPFKVYGLNAIALYVLSGIVATTLYTIKVGDTSVQGWLFENLFNSWLNPKMASFVYAIVFNTIMYLPIWVMYRKKIFIKV